jgi:hypothetical protein
MVQYCNTTKAEAGTDKRDAGPMSEKWMVNMIKAIWISSATYGYDGMSLYMAKTKQQNVQR